MTIDEVPYLNKNVCNIHTNYLAYIFKETLTKNIIGGVCYEVVYKNYLGIISY